MDKQAGLIYCCVWREAGLILYGTMACFLPSLLSVFPFQLYLIELGVLVVIKSLYHSISLQKGVHLLLCAMVECGSARLPKGEIGVVVIGH